MSKVVIRTFNEQLIKTIFKKENLYKEFVGEEEPEIEDFKPCITKENNFWLLLIEENEIVGIGRFDRVNSITMAGHMALLKKGRGKDSYKFGELARKLMNEDYNISKFIGLTPTSKPHAIRWAKKAGWREVGRIKNGHRENGNLYDLVLTESE